MSDLRSLLDWDRKGRRKTFVWKKKYTLIYPLHRGVMCRHIELVISKRIESSRKIFEWLSSRVKKSWCHSFSSGWESDIRLYKC